MNLHKLILTIIIVQFFLIGGRALSAQQNNEPNLAKSDKSAADSFQKCWSISSDQPTTATIASDNAGVIFLSVSEGIVQAVDLKSGAKIWSSDLGGRIISNFVVDDKILFVSSNSLSQDSIAPPQNGISTALRAIGTETGIISWKQDLPSTDKITLLIQNGHLITFTPNGRIASFIFQTGHLLWELKTAFELNSEFISERQTFFIGTGDRNVLQISGTGTIVKKLDTLSRPTAFQFIDDQTLIVGDDRGNVKSLVIRDGELRWKTRLGGKISGIFPSKKRVLVTSYDNFAYLLSTDNGAKVWKKRLPGRISERSILAGDLAIVESLGDRNIYLIDVKDGKTLNQIVLDDYLTQSPLLIDDHLVLQTAHGVDVYARGRCTSAAK